MKSYRVITLFAPPLPPPRRGSLSIAVSIVAHVAGCTWVFFGLSHTPRLEGKPTLQRFTVRVLNVPPPEPQIQAPAVTEAAHPRQPLPREVAHNLPPEKAPAPMTSPASLPSPAPVPAAAASQLPKLIHQQQTLIQPDAPPDVVLLHKTPLPTVFLWTPANVPIKPVISAPTQKSIVAKLRPSVEPPNRELNLSDMRMSSTPFTTALHALPPSTTSPVVVRGPDQAKQQMPATASKPTAEPTPARVLSLSELQAQDGPAAIPLANASARPTASASLSAGRGEKPADAVHGTAATTQAGNGAGSAPAAPAAPAEKASTRSGAGTQMSADSGPPAQDSSSGPGNALQGPVTRIVLPKDGQYGVVVVGTSLADKYPETVDIWSGRLVYTVYLHVGAGKSWILQYSLPPGSAAAAAAGSTRPDAPWPYDIVRPKFDPDDFNSDALMVHGFVNSAGRFERLALVFPAEFAKVKFLLSALQQWEFRPARQNGQTAAVEVLLIIPEEIE